MLSACLSRILPDTPSGLVIAANSLYTAVTERQNIDAAALHVLGLASSYLPENINAVSRLAAFIRDTVTGWTDGTFLEQFLGGEESSTSTHLFTALAVTAIVAGRWMKDEGSPQRGLLKVPAFMANIFIRASHYWTALGNMAGTLPSGAEMPENTAPSQYTPAFEVNTRVEITGDVCDAAISCPPSAPRLTAFSSNSTANPEVYTRGTVPDRPAVPGAIYPLPVPEQAHYLAVNRLRQESGLSDLLHCTTRKTETRRQTSGEVITATHFNTKCDATVYPAPLMKATESTPVYTDMPVAPVSSSPGRVVLPPLVVSSETGSSSSAPHSDNSGNSFGSMLKPVVNALYESGQFIDQQLTFPAANAMPLAGTDSTMAAGIIHDLKSDCHIITGEQKKNELISSLVQYQVSDGQLSADESKDVELWLRSEAANMPVVIAPLDNDDSGKNRTIRAVDAANDPRTAEHIKAHCAFEEEVLNAQGEKEGLFWIQRIENIFRAIYDNNPNGRPTPEERGIADGLNISTDILSLGIKPLIVKLIANAKRREYYKNKGDNICAERFRRLFIAELATSLDVDGLTYTPRGSTGKVKPSELLHALPPRERAAFYTRNPHSGIRKEILLELKQGNGAINDNGRRIYLKPTEKTNEFVTYYPYAVKPEWLERRVIVDENNLTWRYADSFDTSGLNVDIREGKTQIKLYGDYYDLQQNNAGNYEIVVKKTSGIKEYIPVYMEPLSRTWHLSTSNEHPAFSAKEIDYINKVKVKEDRDFNYIPTENNNKNYYGNGNIYIKEKIGDSGRYTWGRYVEMNGELVPVKEVVTPGHGVHYEVYDLQNPIKKGRPIEWDGNRWLFERNTSVHVSKELKKIIQPVMFSEKVDAGKLSAPDYQGLRYNADGDKYLKVKGKFIKIDTDGNSNLIKSNNGDIISIHFTNNLFKIKYSQFATSWKGVAIRVTPEADKLFVSQTKDALDKIASKPLGYELLDSISNKQFDMKFGYKVCIMPANSNKSNFKKTVYTGSNVTKSSSDINASTPNVGSASSIKWNPVMTKTPDGDRPAYIGLAHELIHAKNNLDGNSKLINSDKNSGNIIKEDEYQVVGLGIYKDNHITENKIRKEHDLPLRQVYSGLD